jgi:hypothetical protein
MVFPGPNNKMQQNIEWLIVPCFKITSRRTRMSAVLLPAPAFNLHLCHNDSASEKNGGTLS